MVDADATLKSAEWVAKPWQFRRSHRCGGFGRLPLYALFGGFGFGDRRESPATDSSGLVRGALRLLSQA